MRLKCLDKLYNRDINFLHFMVSRSCAAYHGEYFAFHVEFFRNCSDFVLIKTVMFLNIQNCQDREALQREIG